jgi:hypothetical protein
MAKTPGVGYDPRNFGLTIARWLSKTPPTNRSHAIDFAVDPWAGGLTNEKFEARYGPGSGFGPTGRHKWLGFDNEHKVNFVRPALEELFQSFPNELGGSGPSSFDGHATDLEVEDCAATNHTGLVVQARSLLKWQGTPENPIVVSDKTKPERFTLPSPLGLWEDNYFNLTPKGSGGSEEPPAEPPSRFVHKFLEKVTWDDFLHYFTKRIAWPIAAALSRHPEVRAEALENWLHHVDAHPSSKTFLELKAKYDPGS